MTPQTTTHHCEVLFVSQVSFLMPLTPVSRTSLCSLCLQMRIPLFPGKTCFPLSADSALSYKSIHDQLNVIFDVIGTPSPDEVEGMDDIAKKYLATLQPTPKRCGRHTNWDWCQRC